MHLSKQGRRVVCAHLIKFGKDQPRKEQSDLQFWPMQETVGVFTPLFPFTLSQALQPSTCCLIPMLSSDPDAEKGNKKKKNNCFCFLVTDAMYFLSVLRRLLPEKITQ